MFDTLRVSVLTLVSLGFSGCVVVPNEPQTQSTASTVAYEAFGPRQPRSGYSSTGAIALTNDGGVFGTSDSVAVTDSGLYPDNALSIDPLLGDTGTDPFAGDIAAESALLAGVTLPGDDGSAAYFDSDVGDTVQFGTDSADLSEEARSTLRRQAAWLQTHGSVSASIEGHTDERGTREYNIALGERRASAVRGYLTALGVDGSRLRKVSFGKEQPIAYGSDESSWAQNRRAVTVLENTSSGLAEILSDSSTSSSFETAPPLPSALASDDPLLDPTLDSLLGISGDDPLSGGIPENPVLQRIDSGS